MLALMDYLRDSGAAADPAEAVDTAVLHWLAAMKQGGAENTPAAPRGYQWKSLFLPDGSWVRMAYRGDHEYARVEGDRLMYRGRPTSPNRFANEFTDTVRNAWYDLSIRMPGEKNWKMAYQRRKEIDLAARQPTAPAREPSPPPTPAPAAPQAPLPAHLAAPVPPQPPAYQYPSAPHCDGGTVIPVPPMLQRHVVPGPGWTEPERRKYRYRIEDVAFD
ncbi:hypothetical protein GW587_26520 [Duganella sp. SAP-35]|uniref:Uncharacterized protein n=1 Tax=Duganella aceris TaxID=2703883 RepID=A0ABX0FSZ3_9BURK|nr:hypothetical protein [Duganella aceris]